jgi:hypothetical protein
VLLLKDAECVSGCRNMDIDYEGKKKTVFSRLIKLPLKIR